MATNFTNRAEWLFGNLACPKDGSIVTRADNRLICPQGHEYPIVEGVPVMLRDDVAQTMWVAAASLAKAREYVAGNNADPYFLETLGLSPQERADIAANLINRSQEIDPVISYIVPATSGYLYQPLKGKLASYPIPQLRLPQGNGKTLLDLGCNWGRWTIAAARTGYAAVGIDPSLGAVLAAKRLSRELGVECGFVVADARYLPFPAGSFTNAFSYSVLQHFSKPDVGLAIKEIARVLRQDGVSLVQMPNKYGIRSLQHQFRRRFREAQEFEVRYWTPAELVKVFGAAIGPSSLTVDGYFGLGIQASDLSLLPFKYRAVVKASEMLRKLSLRLHAMNRAADSLYVTSRRV